MVLRSTVAAQTYITDEWPSSLHVSSGPCSRVIESSAGNQRHARITGTIVSEDYRWIDLTISGRVIVRGPSGTREFNPQGVFHDIRAGRPNPFEFGIDRGPLGPGEEVVSCDATFAEGARITRKPARITIGSTPVAKDEGCFRDFIGALKAEGVERRKKLQELLEYRCVDMVPADYIVSAERLQTITGPSGPVTAQDASFVRPYVEPSADSPKLQYLYTGLTLPSYIGDGTTLVIETVRRKLAAPAK